MDIRYLGHAGFVVEHRNVRLLMDPWFYPAFLQSWFPYPDNRSLLHRVLAERFDYLYVSHGHQDHYDERVLKQLPRSITVIVPRYRSNVLERRFRALGFDRIIALQHRQSYELAPGFTATMWLDTSHKEDSGLLLDADGFRFLDLNDCNTPTSELPHDIDVLAAQYSGAMWYPHCYDYPADVMREKANDVRQGLLETLYHKVRLTGARSYVPSAGPACFLDPSLEAYNPPEATIFPLWEHVADQFHAACPDVAVQPLNPGDALHVETAGRSMAIERDPHARTREDLGAYRERRRDEWSEFYAVPETPLTAQAIECYFARLPRRHTQFLLDFRKNIRLVAGGSMWGVLLGRLAEQFVIEGEEPYDPEYMLYVPPRVLRAIVEGRAGWEEALLSHRITLWRNPDVLDLTSMGALRYGSTPKPGVPVAKERCRETLVTPAADLS
jgi:UDP-MurNAc hydroxylase